MAERDREKKKVKKKMLKGVFDGVGEDILTVFSVDDSFRSLTVVASTTI
jgi:hypothetical protein